MDSQKYLGAQVQVFYTTGVSDRGLLLQLDSAFVELIKDNREVLVIPIRSVRLIKVLDLAPDSTGSATLLRAARISATTDKDDHSN